MAGSVVGVGVVAGFEFGGGGGVTASKPAVEEPAASTGSSKSGGLFSRFLGQK